MARSSISKKVVNLGYCVQWTDTKGRSHTISGLTKADAIYLSKLSGLCATTRGDTTYYNARNPKTGLVQSYKSILRNR